MRLQTLVFISITPVVFALASCGDDVETNPTTSSTSASGTGGEGGGAGGMGGMGVGGAGGGAGGMGGAAGGAGGAGGMGGAGGAGGMGGAGGSMSNLVNGCDPAMAMDMTGMATATIASMGLAYNPKCIKVSAGTDVTWDSNFMLHPLVGGTVSGVTKTPDANSPIKPTSSGMSVTFKLPAKGTYGFYCDVHAAGGMAGAVFVE